MKNPIAQAYGSEATVQLADLASNPDRHLAILRQATTEQIYEAVLEIQIAATWEELRRSLLRDANWARTRTVLDFGCGPGHLLALLCAAFPEKIYAGVDRSAELLSSAAERLKPFTRWTLHQQDVYEFAGGPYEYAIARMLLQHLNDHDRFLETARRVVVPGGTLCILDARDEGWRENPPAQVMNGLREALGSKGGQGDQRRVAESLLRRAPSHGFEVTAVEQVRTVFRDPPDVERYVRHALLGHEVCSRLLNLPFDLEKVLDELAEWARLPNAQGEWGQSRVLLRKS